MAASRETTVSISDYAFDPATVTVNVADTVTFLNDADETHTTATYDSGTYVYYCRIHPAMHGTIVVIPDGAGE